MKRIALLAAPLLAIGLLAGGCGDDSADAAGAPKDATVGEFCRPFVDLIQMATAGGDVSDTDAVKVAKDTAAKMQDAGTPTDMPSDARKGFELIVKRLGDLSSDATKDEVAKAQEFSTEEQKYSDAFGQYLTEKCADQILPTAGAS